MSSKDRKWRLAKWTWILCAGIIIIALVMWVVSAFTEKGASNPASLITQGLSGIGGVLALYSAANVSQKGVIGKNYQPDLNDKKGGKDE